MSNFLQKLKQFVYQLFNSKSEKNVLKISYPTNINQQKFKNKKSFLDFAYSAPYKYKNYYIPKRNSTQKRLISQPTAELKFVQKDVINQLSAFLPIHNCAYAYVKNRSIKDNAELHRHSNYVLKLDFKHFFHSIRPKILFNQLEHHQIKLSEIDQTILSFIFFWREKKDSPLKLSIGAPSSPVLSNFIMYRFDEMLNQFCEKHQCIYSRYADDITISSKYHFYDLNFPQHVQNLLDQEFQGKIKLNAQKTKYLTRKHRRFVTGITLTNDAKLSIGRQQKRLLSAKIHHFKINKLNDEQQILSLKGQLAFAFYIQPELKVQFSRKYGEELLHKIMSY